MAKHVWLRKPTGSMTADIFEGFAYALSIGATPAQAACATGYMLERKSQDLRSNSRLSLITSTASTGYKIMKGSNKDNYPLVVMNHKDHLTILCIEKMELIPDTHWNIAMDYAQDTDNKVIYYLLAWLNRVDVEFIPLGTVPVPEKPQRRQRRPNLPRSKFQVGDRVWQGNGWTTVQTPNGLRQRSAPQEYVVVGYPRANTYSNLIIQSVGPATGGPHEFRVNDKRVYTSEADCQESINKRYQQYTGS